MAWRFLVLVLLLRAAQAQSFPDNDAFANRISVEGTNITLKVFQLDATREPGEPRHCPEPLTGYLSLWWTWTAPASGYLVVISDSPDPSLWVTAYRGDTVDSLTYLGDGNPYLSQKALFRVQAGRRYHLAVSLAGEGSPPYLPDYPSDVHLRFLQPPPNDNFADRIKLSGERISIVGHTIGASREDGEPPHGDSPLPDSVWWEWTPEKSGTVWVRYKAGIWGTIRFYTGASLPELVSIPPWKDHLGFDVVQGRPVQIAVAPFTRAQGGTFDYQLILSTMQVILPLSGIIEDVGQVVRFPLTNLPPNIKYLSTVGMFYARSDQSALVDSELIVSNVLSGSYSLQVHAESAEGDIYRTPEFNMRVALGADNFQDAREILPGATMIGGDFASATVEPGEPPVPVPSEATVWWQWTAPARGQVRFRSPSFPRPASIDVFRGGSLPELIQVPLVSEGELLTFMAERGSTYRLRLRQIGVMGSPAQWFSFSPQIPNDDFTSAETIDSLPFERVLPLGFASCEPDEPGACYPTAGSRWYRLDSPGGGVLRVDLDSLAPHLGAVEIFEGSALASMQQVSSANNLHALKVSPASTYYLRVQIPLSGFDIKSLSLRCSFVPTPANDRLVNATLLEGQQSSVPASNDAATSTPDETTFGMSGPAVWFRYQASTDGALQAKVVFPSSSPSIDVNNCQISFFQRDAGGTLTWAPQMVADGRSATLQLQQGQEVWMAVWELFRRDPLDPNPWTLEYSFVARPANDDFAPRLALEGAAWTVQGPNWNATLELGEPSGFRSLWWEWTAPVTADLFVIFTGPKFEMFTGSADLAGLQLTSSLVEPLDDKRKLAYTRVEKGIRYFLRTSLDFPELAPPWASQGRIGSVEAVARLTQLGLTSPLEGAVFPEGTLVPLEIITPDPSLDGRIVSVGFWRWSQTSSSAGWTPLGDLANPPWRLLSLLPPGLHRLRAVATNEAGVVTPLAPVTVRVTPRNDLFANAIPLEGRRLETNVVLSGATSEPNERFLDQIAGTVWYRWLAPASGQLQLSRGDLLAVFVGPDLPGLSEIGSRPRFLPLSAAVTAGSNYWIRAANWFDRVGEFSSFPLKLDLQTISLKQPAPSSIFAFREPITIAPETSEVPENLLGYELTLGTNPPVTLDPAAFPWTWTNAPPGDLAISIRPILRSGEIALAVTNTLRVRPVNDLLENRTTILPAQRLVAGSFLLATSDTPGPSAPVDVWYDWTAPADGVLYVQQSPNQSAVKVEMFTQNEASTLVAWKNRETIATGRLLSWAVSAGTTYIVKASRSGSGSFSNPEFTLQWNFFAPALNDSFAQRIRLEGPQGEVAAPAALASAEPGEPPHFGDTPGSPSVWWTWVPPAEGVLELSYLRDTATGAMLAPWSGTDLATLQRLPSFAAWSGGGANTAWYLVHPSTPLHIALAAFRGDSVGLSWKWRLISRPPNDDFAARAMLSGENPSVKSTLWGATSESSEPAELQFDNATVWWSWETAREGYLLVSVDPESRARVGVFQGENLPGLQLLTFQLSPDPREIPVSPGIRYTIVAAGTYPPRDDFTLHVNFRPIPQNDNFDSAEAIPPAGARVLVDHRRATREFREPLHAGFFGGRSLWYTFQSPRRGTLELRSDFVSGQLLAAYTGSGVTKLSPVASAGVRPDLVPLRFNVAPGETYHIAIDNGAGFDIPYPLSFRFEPEIDPPLLSIASAENSTLRLRAAAPGRSWSLEASIDLLTWLERARGESETALDYSFVSDPAEPTLFFRLRLLE